MPKRFKKAALKRRQRRSKQTGNRLTRFEILETRRVLAGIVDVTLDDATGLLTLVGDINSNEVEIRQDLTAAADSFQLVGLGGTRLAVDTVFGRTEFDDLTLTNVKDINIDFTAGGTDTLSFLPPSDGAGGSMDRHSSLEGDLSITTDGPGLLLLDGVDVETLSIVQPFGGSPTNVDLSDVIVVNVTEIITTAGESNIKIEDSHLDGGLYIENGIGDDILSIEDTEIGGGVVRPAPAKDYLPEVLTILNGDGRTDITMVSSTTVTPGTVVHGGASVTNGDGYDSLLMEGVHIYGGVVIDNGAGDAFGGANVMIEADSMVGTDLIDGNGLVLTNGIRRDTLSINDSTLPNGMLVDNSAADDAGNDVEVLGSTIGGNPLYGTAVQVINGDGNDVMNLSQSMLLGLVDLGLGGGNDSVMMDGTTVTGILSIGNNAPFIPAFILAELQADLPGLVAADSSDGEGRDSVTLQNTEVMGGTYINLGDDVDTLELLTGTRLHTLGVLEGGGSFSDRVVLATDLVMRQDLRGFEVTEIAPATA
ncbi:MAG: hypothetical protein AAGD07_06065 [Planctomycetota bacterium]